MKLGMVVIVPSSVALLLLLMAIGLFKQELPIQSPRLSKPFPDVVLPELFSSQPSSIYQYCLAKRCLVNVWASWCASCVPENRQLLNLAEQNTQLYMVGINYKDDRGQALAWLKQYGNPYTFILNDEKGELGFELGVYGVPESYLLSLGAIIEYRWVGEITAKQVMKAVAGIK